MGVVLLAMFLANSPWGDIYASFWNYEVHLQIGEFNFFSHNGHHMTLMTFINDALMAVFFFSVGLEIKREILVGELSSFRQALLPIVAACGGMLVPVPVSYTHLETGNHRLGKHRTGDGAHRCRFRNAGMRLYFQAAVTTSRRNPENGAG